MKSGANRSAFDDAVRILARRGHPRAELARKLSTRGHGRADIDAAFTRLEELNYLEPESELAERYAAELARKRGATPRAVRQKMAQRGFEEGDAQRAVASVFSDWDARVAAFETVEGVEDPDKAARVLTRRGFPADAISEVVRRVRADRAAREESAE